MKRLLIALSLFAAACGPVSVHTVPVPPPDRTAEFTATCTDVYRTELLREPDPEGLQGCINQARAGRTKDDLIAWIRASDEYIALHSFHPLPPITADGTILRVNGQPWVMKGVTAFQLLDRWSHGQDVDPFLEAYKGFNTLIVFSYTERAVWGDEAWDAPVPSQAVAFVKEMNKRGWYVEFVLLTSSPVQFPSRLEEAKAILGALAAARQGAASNVLIRLGNEPEQQNGPGNPIYTTTALRADAEASGFLYDSGLYAANGSTWFGDYISPHTKRDAEWPRRGHDCLDITHGASDAPQLGHQPVPCFLGEPENAGVATADDYEAYCATGVQFGVGCAVHSQTGRYALLPTEAERLVIAGALRGLNAFPGDTNTHAYRRIDGVSLRTYVVGDTMVMIRPNHPGQAPEAGWHPLDAFLWMR